MMKMYTAGKFEILSSRNKELVSFQILTSLILTVLFYEFFAAGAAASPERSASDSDFANTAKHLMQASSTI